MPQSAANRSVSTQPVSGDYATSQQSMLAGAGHVEQASTQIRGQLASLRSEVEVMMGGWRGTAAASFAHVHESFESEAAKINAALTRMHEALVATYRIYDHQETTQARTLTGIAGRMTG